MKNIYINGRPPEHVILTDRERTVLIPLYDKSLKPGFNELIVLNKLRSEGGEQLSQTYVRYFKLEKLPEIFIEGIPATLNKGKNLNFCFSADTSGYFKIMLNGVLIKDGMYSAGSEECSTIDHTSFSSGWNRLTVTLDYGSLTLPSNSKYFYYDDDPPLPPEGLTFQNVRSQVCFTAPDAPSGAFEFPFYWSVRAGKNFFDDNQFEGLIEVGHGYVEKNNSACADFEAFLLELNSPYYPLGISYFVGGKIRDSAGNWSVLSEVISDSIYRSFAPPVTPSDIEIGDFDRDGYGDFAVGISSPHPEVWIYRGKDLNLYFEKLTTEVFPEVISLPLGQAIGLSLSSGDLNGDGYSELLVGMPGSLTGRIYALSFNSNLSAQYLFEITGSSPLFGYDVLGFDFNCDGSGDVAVSAPDFAGDKGKVEIRDGANPGLILNSIVGEPQEFLGLRLIPSNIDYNEDGCREIFVPSVRYSQGKGRVIWMGEGRFFILEGQNTQEFGTAVKENYYSPIYSTLDVYDKNKRIITFYYKDFTFVKLNEHFSETLPSIFVTEPFFKIISSHEGGSLFINRGSSNLKFRTDLITGYIFSFNEVCHDGCEIKKGDVNGNEFLDFAVRSKNGVRLFVR